MAEVGPLGEGRSMSNADELVGRSQVSVLA